MGSSVARIDDRAIEHEVRGSGPPCLLAPVGWGIDYTLWAHYLADLEKKLTMIYFNPRGIGDSSKIASPSDCSTDSIVSDMERLRKHLGFEKIAVMGHSAGGFSALKYAIRRPENVSALVLIATAANTEYEADFDELLRTDKRIARVHEEMAKPGKEEMAKEELMRRNLIIMFSVYFKDYEPFRGEFEELLSASKMSVDHLRYHQQADLPRYDVLDDLPQISCPTLILAGDYDPICPPKFSRVMDDAIPESKLMVFENSGHCPFIEERDEFVRSVVDFLEGT
ncbi:MAG: alpha/beta hydrolase [Thermoplasmata archaeon]|nr:alpha/beta hydrolase [Thermoplasmata archaeon]